jgi:hypothetical protein
MPNSQPVNDSQSVTRYFEPCPIRLVKFYRSGDHESSQGEGLAEIGNSRPVVSPSRMTDIQLQFMMRLAMGHAKHLIFRIDH